MRQFPKLLRSEMSVKVIQSRDHILNTYSEKISEFAEVCSWKTRCSLLNRLADDKIVLFARNVSRGRISRSSRTLGESERFSSVVLDIKLIILR